MKNLEVGKEREGEGLECRKNKILRYNRLQSKIFENFFQIDVTRDIAI
jgi:hypothetical protein